MHGGEPGRTRVREDRAASSVEYSLAVAAVAGVLVVALLSLGDRLSGILDCVSDQLKGGVVAASCSGGSGADPAPDPTSDTWTDPTGGPTATGPATSPTTSGTTSPTTTSPTTTSPTTTSPTPTDSGPASG